MTDTLKIRCDDCEKKYEIRYGTNKEMLGWRIDFSVCPYCGKPQNPKLQNEYKNNWTCVDCHVPEPFTRRRKTIRNGNKQKITYGKHCISCYFYVRRKFIKLCSSTKKIIC